MDIHELHAVGDDDTLRLLRRLADSADSVGRAEREIVALVIEMLGPRPTSALAALRRLTDEYVPWLERRLVRRARETGVSWAGIARVLGRSRQSVHRKYDGEAELDALLPPAPLVTHVEAEARESLDASVERRRMRDVDDAAAGGDLVPW